MLINETQFADNLFKYYKQQRGGSGIPYPVFRGSPYQWGGAGIGDILRTLARAGVPIVGGVVGDYIKAATSSFGEGKTVGESLKSAFGPAFGVGAKNTISALKKAQGSDYPTNPEIIAPPGPTVQAGTGRRRGRKRHVSIKRVYKKAKRMRNTHIPTNF